MTTASVDRLTVEGGELRFRVRGTGPFLILLTSGDGDADAFDGMADDLAGDFTVVTYDRRGLSQSSLSSPVDGLRLEMHSEDVHRLIARLTDEPVLVFGASLGALIGLDLVTRHPAQICCLVAHEPPAPELLDEPARNEAVRDQLAVEDAFRSDGIALAMRKFVEIARIDFQDREADAKLPSPTPERMRNLQFFLTHDAPAAREYRLGIDPLIRQARKIIPAAGETSSEAWPHRCAAALAIRIDRPLTRFPGGHAGFSSHPRGFAARLRETLAAFHESHGE